MAALQASLASLALQRVLPVELPEDTLQHIAGYLDIDTRRTLGIPPGKLTRDRYAPLENLVAPVSYNLKYTVVSLRLVSPVVSLKYRVYRYKRIRVFYDDGSLREERLLYAKPEGWRSTHFIFIDDSPPHATPTGVRLGPHFYNLSQAHSWYKHLSMEGSDFALFKENTGQWRFSLWENRPAEYDSHRVRLGPFFRGVEGMELAMGNPYMFGFHGILRKAGEDVFREWIEHHYPEYSHIEWKEGLSTHNYDAALEEIYMNEYTMYWNQIKNIAGKYKPLCREFHRLH